MREEMMASLGPLDPLTLPYYCLVALYIAMYTPLLQAVRGNYVASLFKILPIWYLAFCVFWRGGRSRENDHASSQSEKDKPDSGHLTNGKNGIHVMKNGISNGTKNILDHSDSSSVPPNRGQIDREELARHQFHRSMFFRGLLISTIGDVFLVFDSLFKPGVVAFAVAQYFYLKGLSKYYIKGRIAWLAFPCHCVLFYVLYQNMEDAIMPPIIFGYSALIHTMLFFAVASFESRPGISTLYGALGASSFVLSDFLIGYTKWGSPVAYGNGIITFSYYIAQLLLSLSVPKLRNKDIL